MKWNLTLLILLFFSSCIPTPKKNTSNEILVEQGSECAFKPVLQEAVLEYIARYPEQDWIYAVYVSDDKDGCQIQIGSNGPVYQSELLTAKSEELTYVSGSLKGYTYVDERTVVLYSLQSLNEIACISNLIDTTRLIPYRDSIPGFEKFSLNSNYAEPLHRFYELKGDSLIFLSARQ